MKKTLCESDIMNMDNLRVQGENLLTKHYPKVDENGDIETFGESLK